MATNSGTVSVMAQQDTEQTAQVFSISDTASKRIAFLLEAEQKPFSEWLLMAAAVQGFQYKFDFDTDKTDDDLVFSAKSITVLVDDMSISFLEHAELDYVEELVGSYFVVNNPNATANCGCGTSFSI